MHKLSYHASKFSEKVREMNDTKSLSLTLSAAEARNLHTDIFALLAKIAELSTTKPSIETGSITIGMDGGTF